MLLPVKKKKRRDGDVAIVRGTEADFLPDTEFVNLVVEITSWGLDMDPVRDLDAMRRIWQAEQVDGQVWRVTCKRRRLKNGIHRRETVLVIELSTFPSAADLEQVVCMEGFGGGVFSVTSTRSAKYTHRFTLAGEPEDPERQPAPTEPAKPGKEDLKTELQRKLMEIAIEFLDENPKVSAVVAVKYLSRQLGISIPLPALPDPNAPKPYSELSVEEREWLDDHPEEKDAYFRRELGINPPEPTREEKMVEEIMDGLRDRVVQDIVNGNPHKRSFLDSALAPLLEGTDLTELVGRVAELWAGRDHAQPEGDGKVS